MLPIPPEQLVDEATIAFKGTPYAEDVFLAANGCVYTETHIQVTHVYRGILPDRVRMRHPGGQIGNDRQVENQSPTFAIGKPCLVFGTARRDGTLCAVQGSAGVVAAPFEGLVDLLNDAEINDSGRATACDVRGQASGRSVPEAVLAGDLSLTENGISARFTGVDRGEPLTYVLDIDALPAGISESEAKIAVDSALATWSDASSVTFDFAGIMSFGKAAAGFSTDAPADLLIQLHDLYGHIAGSNTVGVGGRRTSSNTNLFPNGGLGGRLGTNEFDIMRSAYVVLDHENGGLSNPITLREVLTHEVGHNLSVTHSSDDPDESNLVLKSATMYFEVHADGRGAEIRSWDSNAVMQAYPPDNTLPYGYERVMHILTSDPPPTKASGLNQVKIDMSDLQGDSVTASLTLERNIAGSFTVDPDGTVYYEPNAAWANTNVPPDGNLLFDGCFVRLSDGNNLSPPIRVRVVSFLEDFFPTDGVPDLWAVAHQLSGTGNEDGDLFTDRQEWFLDTNPTNAASGLILSVADTSITWQARAYETYELLSTTNISDGFTRDRNPITPTGPIGRARLDPDGSGPRYYRLRYLP